MPQLPVNNMRTMEVSVAVRWWAIPALALLMLLLLVDLPVPAAANGAARHLWNLLHVPLFALVTLLLFRILRRSRGRSVLLAVLLAVGSEVAQQFTPRTPSAADLCADFSGIALALVILGSARWRRRTILGLAASALLVPTLLPWVAEARALHARRQAFPSLLRPGLPSGLWQAQGSTRLEVESIDGGGGTGLRVTTAAGSYEGLRYGVPDGVAAAGYTGLRLTCVNPGEAFELGIRADGADGTRQSSRVRVGPGRSTLEAHWPPLPGGGDLLRLVLFTGEHQPARRFLLVEARLLRPVPGGP